MDWLELRYLDKRGGAHGMTGFRGPTLNVYVCPECSKRRMHRPPNHQVLPDQRQQVIRGVTMSWFTDVCDACEKRHNYLLALEERKTKQKAQVAIQSMMKLDDSVSLEEVV